MLLDIPTEYYKNTLALLSILLFLFVLNYIIHHFFAKRHQKINERLKNHSYEKFSDIKTQMNTQSIIGLPFGILRSDIIFIRKNIFVLLNNTPLPFIKINQAVIRLSKSKKEQSFGGVSKTYQIDTIHHQDKKITIDLIDKRQFDKRCQIKIDLKNEDIDIKKLLKKMRL